MTEKFMFGEHGGTELLQHKMSVLKDAGAKVTVETERLTRHKFVVHTVCAEMPPKVHPIKFTRASDYTGEKI